MTNADFWITTQGGRWRTARKAHACAGHIGRTADGSLIRCRAHIAPGDRYLDTNDHHDGHYWGTLKLCAACATREEAMP